MQRKRGFCCDNDQFKKDELMEFIEGRRKKLNKNLTQLGASIGITQQAFGRRIRSEKGNANFEFIHLVKLFKEL